MSYTSYAPTERPNWQTVENLNFYKRVMTWAAATMGVAALSSYFIGPLVPPKLMIPLYIVTVVALIIAGFVRSSRAKVLMDAFAIIIPAILGIILYPTLSLFVKNGMGNIVTMSAAGAFIIFGGMAVIGWTSKVNLDRWLPKLFFIVLGVIALSLLNAFVFKLTFLSLLISVVVLIVFSIYTFIDIQRLRDRTSSDTTPPSEYALNLFLNIYNLFTSLLNIFGTLSR